jgi:hypothetical protein
MSLRHSATVIGSRSWYRLTTWSGARSRQDVFHRPFGQSAPGYRYSQPGRPALYLGNNVHVCWLECNSPSPLSSCRVARFELDAKPSEFLDLPANHATYLTPLQWAHSLRGLLDVEPTMATNSPYVTDVERELAEYLSLWPLLMACSVQKPQGAPDASPEYMASQLLAGWALKQRRWIGIRYFTTKFDESLNTNDISINVVLPARTLEKPSGFCDVLTQRVRCTLPESFSELDRVPDETLFTCEAADTRLAAAGRYMVYWEGGYHHSQFTPFGRMEYWLDRDNSPATRIDDTCERPGYLT